MGSKATHGTCYNRKMRGGSAVCWNRRVWGRILGCLKYAARALALLGVAVMMIWYFEVRNA